MTPLNKTTASSREDFEKLHICRRLFNTVWFLLEFIVLLTKYNADFLLKVKQANSFVRNEINITLIDYMQKIIQQLLLDFFDAASHPLRELIMLYIYWLYIIKFIRLSIFSNFMLLTLSWQLFQRIKYFQQNLGEQKRKTISYQSNPIYSQSC